MFLQQVPSPDDRGDGGVQIDVRVVDGRPAVADVGDLRGSVARLPSSE
jgi:hypothetical protein